MGLLTEADEIVTKAMQLCPRCQAALMANIATSSRYAFRALHAENSMQDWPACPSASSAGVGIHTHRKEKKRLRFLASV